MRYVVSGGTGLIGGHLVASLAADGHQVAVLTRHPGGRHQLPEGVREIGWDARSLGPWAAELDGAAGVVHLAGESLLSWPWTAQKKRRIEESRVESSRLVAEAFATLGKPPPVLVQASAVGYYGPRGEELVSEATGPGEGFLAEVGAAWEAASAAVGDLGVRRPVARTGLVLAADGGALPLMKRPFQLFVGGPVGGGGQWVPWIHLADEVAALRFLLSRPEADGPFNLVAPEPATNEELCRTLAGVLHRPSALRVPAVAVKVLLGEMAEETLLSGQRAVPQRLAELGFAFRFPTLRGALEDLLE